MKRILIAGASGLLGRHLVPLLVDEVELHVAGRAGEAAVGIEFHAIDLAGDFATDGLPERIDAIVYLAQSDHFRDFPERAGDMFAVNVAAPMRLLDYARRAGARRFVYASSGGVYGSGDTAVREDTSLPVRGDLGFYLTSKLCAELLAQNFTGLFDVALLRLFFAYGEGQKRRMLIPRLIDNVRTGTPVTLQGEDGIRINPIHAADAAHAVFAALDLEGSHTINIAGPEALSIRAMCEQIGRQVGRDPEFAMVDPAGDLVADIDRMSRLLAPPTRRFADCLPALLRAGA
ncbi:MAG: NAD-dependent epimerase/dehydratase family protein [Sphingomicrobium sp.]